MTPGCRHRHGISHMPRPEMTTITFNQPPRPQALSRWSQSSSASLFSRALEPPSHGSGPTSPGSISATPTLVRSPRSRPRRHRRRSQNSPAGFRKSKVPANPLPPRAHKVARRLRRRSPSASCFMRRIRAIHRASAASVLQFGARKRFRRDPGSRRSLRSVRTWKFLNAEWRSPGRFAAIPIKLCRRVTRLRSCSSCHPIFLAVASPTYQGS